MKVANSGSSSANVDAARSGKVGAEKVGSDLAMDKVTDSKKKDRAASAAALADSSKVDVSERAQSIKKARELATPGNEVDEAKVARLQKLIDEGKYSVDASAIADKLVDEHLQMPT